MLDLCEVFWADLGKEIDECFKRGYVGNGRLDRNPTRRT